MVVNQDKKHSTCEGPNSVFIKLISDDGHEFIIKREYAMLSSTIRNMFNGLGQYAENKSTEIHLSGISSNVMSTVVKFLIHRGSFKGNIFQEIPPVKESDISLDLLLAANFLEC